MTEDFKKKNLSRRTMVKGAAWSVPVLATAVAVPTVSATTAPTWNGSVTGFCSGDYDLSVLTGIVGSGLVGVAQTALGVLGLEPNASRGFIITATQGDIPAGTVYRLQGPSGLIDLGILQGIIGANVAGIVDVNNGAYDITLNQAITQGNSVTIDLFGALLDVGVASEFTLTQQTADANAGDNSGSVSSLAAVAVNLGSLNPLLSGSLAVQLCA